MVNSGRPSRRCSSCKKRKIRCDEFKPSCSQCTKSGWVCPGYKDTADITFCNQTQLVVKKVRKDNQSLPSRRNESPTRSLSPGLTDRGTAFFVHQYVSSGTSHSDTSARGNHEYLPKLLGTIAPDSPHNVTAARIALESATAAAGLAGLANSTGSQNLIPEAYRLYGNAIRQIQQALRDPLQVHADETLAAVMLMGTFETIASADKDSMKSFSYHTIAAAKLIEDRGPQQFKTEEAVRLYHQLRRIIIMTLLQMQEPVPYAVAKWSQWACTIQKPDEFYANRFGEINARLAAVRADIKYRNITDPSAVATALLPFDNELESWSNRIPMEWKPKLYRRLQDDASQSIHEDLDSQYEAYPDLWVASMWNNYRVVRILIHETIMSITLKYGTPEQKANLQPSVDLLREMTTQVCRSVAFHLGTQQHRKSMASIDAIPGGYLLAWPLFLAGMLRTTPRAQRQWMASRMHHIAVTMGLRLAHSFAEALQIPTDGSFSDPEFWIMGGFWPQ